MLFYCISRFSITLLLAPCLFGQTQGLDGRAVVKQAQIHLEAARYVEGQQPRIDQATRVGAIRAYLAGKLDADVRRSTAEFLLEGTSDVGLSLNLAQMLKEGGYSELAKDVLAKAVESFPDSPVPHLQLGLILLDNREFENAAVQIGRAAQLDPSSPRYSLELGRALLLWRHYSTANDYLLAIKDRFGSFPEFRYEFAYATYGRKRYEEALTQATNLIRDQPEMADAYYLVGNCYWALNDVPLAIDGYKKAIALNSNNASYYTALGTIQRSSGAVEEASSNLRKAVRLDGTNLEAQFELALCFETNGDLKGAEELLESINRADAALPRAHSLLARVYFKQGKSKEAEQEEVEAKFLREKSLPSVEREFNPERRP